MGTTWSANTATNRMFLPRKFIHANEYAASDAMRIGITTAGIVMTIELMM